MTTPRFLPTAMARHLFFTALAGLLAGPAFGQEDAPPDEYDRTLAVLPFKNLKADPQTEWLGGAAAETVSTKLAGVPELTLVERTDIQRVMQEQDFQKLDVADPAGAVQVGKVLAAERIAVGTYAVEGDTVLFNVRVLDVATSEVLNAANVTGKMAEVFETLNVLADAVIESFDKKVAIVDARPVVTEAPPRERVVLTGEQREYVHRTGSTSLSAFEAFGRALIAPSPEAEIEQLNLALQIDDGFSLAYYHRAEAYNRRGDYSRAIRDYDRTTRLTPRFAVAWFKKGETCERAHRPEQARSAYGRFTELRPKKTVQSVKKANERLKRFKGKKDARERDDDRDDDKGKKGERRKKRDEP